MSQLTIDLALDNYRSTLSQAYNWWSGSIYVNNVPNVSFPTGKKVLLTVNPEKTNMQVVELDWRDSVAKTLNCTWATVKRGEWANYSATDHSIGSEVKISIPYDARDDIKTAVNTKVNSDWDSIITDGNLTFAWSASKYWVAVKELTTAQIAALSSPPNGSAVVDSTLWAFQVKIWWSFQSMGAWATTPNASTTVAGKVEKATSGEVTAWTSTGWTGAELFVWPAELKTVTDWLTTSINAKPSIASNATASTGSNTTDAINALQLKKYFWPEPIAWTTYTASSISWSVWSVTSASWTYAQAKIWTIQRTWTYRISVTISAASFWTQWYAKIYKAWVAYSSEQTNASWWSPATVSRDLAFTEWETVSLWIKSNWWWSWTVSFTDLSIKYDLTNQNAFVLA